MDIIAYGEDALTLWAMTRKLGQVLNDLGDQTNPSRCQAFFRPSFGRGGGANSAKFGEFDFIILADHHLYLGESKWSERRAGVDKELLSLTPSQLARHHVFKFYLQNSHLANDRRWQELVGLEPIKIPDEMGGGSKRVAPASSRLAANLQTVLRIIGEHYKSRSPKIVDVVLYFHHQAPSGQSPESVSDSFTLVKVDYTEIANDNFIRLKCNA